MNVNEKLYYRRQALVQAIMGTQNETQLDALIGRLESGEATAITVEQLTAQRDKFIEAITEIGGE